jgi:hypothetical protein
MGFRIPQKKLHTPALDKRHPAAGYSVKMGIEAEK